MAWVLIQTPLQATWADYERVTEAMDVDNDPPEGLIMHAAGEQNGRWRSVEIWESQAAFERFRDERLMPVVREVLSEEMVDAGPPPQESFETKNIIKP
jgi:hypothetical protein